MDAGPVHFVPSQLAVLPGGEDGISQGAEVAPGGRPTLVWRSRLPIAVAFGVALAALVLWLATARSSREALRQLPAEQRAALVERASANLRDICAAGDRPREFCKEQASLLLELPECGEACQVQARAELMADSAVK